MVPRELDAYATSTVGVLGRSGVSLVATTDGPVVVWSAPGEFEERMAAGLAGPFLALHLEPDSGHFHVGRPALVRVGGQLHLVAELPPQALDSARELAAALAVHPDRRHRRTASSPPHACTEPPTAVGRRGAGTRGELALYGGGNRR
ncbi:hypothetical protein [Kitasatospora camelliae]|uniref:Roadblock/LAMTOR2 domain-containing protein n=1 Tax=Kitasatospora camelliae TaxID=3156397 RepID=A0AAU8K6J6_9ACTN